MNRKRAGIRVVLSICAAMAWWGVLYPELTMTPDTYTVVWEEEVIQSTEDRMEWAADGEIYEALLEADTSRIRYKSRLLMEMEALIKRLE